MTAPQISRAQLATMHATLGELHVTDRDRRLRVIDAIVYRRVTSSGELTRDEARTVIDVLAGALLRDDPAGYVDGLVSTAERRGPS